MKIGKTDFCGSGENPGPKSGTRTTSVLISGPVVAAGRYNIEAVPPTLVISLAICSGRNNGFEYIAGRYYRSEAQCNLDNNQEGRTGDKPVDSVDIR